MIVNNDGGDAERKDDAQYKIKEMMTETLKEKVAETARKKFLWNFPCLWIVDSSPNGFQLFCHLVRASESDHLYYNPDLEMTTRWWLSAPPPTKLTHTGESSLQGSSIGVKKIRIFLEEAIRERPLRIKTARDHYPGFMPPLMVATTTTTMISYLREKKINAMAARL